jgi:hypothetical protein
MDSDAPDVHSASWAMPLQLQSAWFRGYLRSGARRFTATHAVEVRCTSPIDTGVGFVPLYLIRHSRYARLARSRHKRAPRRSLKSGSAGHRGCSRPAGAVSSSPARSVSRGPTSRLASNAMSFPVYRRGKRRRRWGYGFTSSPPRYTVISRVVCTRL